MKKPKRYPNLTNVTEPTEPPDEYCPECMSLKRKPNKECVNHDSYWRDVDDCPKCNKPKRIRNPSGYCDHLELYYFQSEKDTMTSAIDSLSEAMVKTIANKHIKVQDTHEGESHQRHWYLVAQKMLKKLVKEYDKLCKSSYE